jgi:hypothetical protein
MVISKEFVALVAIAVALWLIFLWGVGTVG